MTSFLSGCIAFASLTAGIFFLRFWRRTHDRLFAFFAVSFEMMAFERLVLAIINTPQESVYYVYFIRLIAFLLIIVAVVDKNWPRRRPGTLRAE